MLNLRFLKEYLVDKILDKQEVICLHTNGFNSSHSLVQPYFSQKGQNVTPVDVLRQFTQTIYFEKLLSDESETSTFHENVFNGARCLTCCV